MESQRSEENMEELKVHKRNVISDLPGLISPWRMTLWEKLDCLTLNSGIANASSDDIQVLFDFHHTRDSGTEPFSPEFVNQTLWKNVI